MHFDYGDYGFRTGVGGSHVVLVARELELQKSPFQTFKTLYSNIKKTLIGKMAFTTTCTNKFDLLQRMDLIIIEGLLLVH